LREGGERIEEIWMQLGVPGLEAFGVREEHFTDIISKARRASSMKGNPIALDDRELEDVLITALTDISSDNAPLFL
jgi:alcohol dehydrogenase class IV